MTYSRKIARLLLIVFLCWRDTTTVRAQNDETTTTASTGQDDNENNIPLLNFTMQFDSPVTDIDLLAHSIQDYLQAGLLWDIQHVTLLVVEEEEEEESSSSSFYRFGPVTVQMEEAMDSNVIQHEQVSLLNDIALLEYVLQQDFSNPDLQVLQVRVEKDSMLQQQTNNNQGMFSDSLSSAQIISLLTMGVLVVLSIAFVVCLRRYRRHVQHHMPLKLKLDRL